MADASSVGDNNIQVVSSGGCCVPYHAVMTGPMLPMRGCEATMPAAFGPGPMIRGDAFPVAATPMEIPSTWTKAGTDVLPAVPADVPKIVDGAQPTVTVVPHDTSKPYGPDNPAPHVLVQNDGKVVYAEGFTGKEANIRVAFEPNASAQAVQDAALTAGKMQASNCCEGCAAPKIVDESSGKLPSDFQARFDEAVKPKPNPDKDPEIDPGPDNGGGDCRPGPGPKPDPNDDKIDPENDKVKPDTDKVVDGKDAAARTKEFLKQVGDSLTRSGGMHPRMYGHFLGAILPPNILALMKRLAENPDDPALQQELAKAMEDEAPNIARNLDKQIAAANSPEDKAALGEFKKQLLGPNGDGKGVDPKFLAAVAKFQKKCESGESMGESDVNGLFTNPAVRRAITNLALGEAGKQAKVDASKPELGTLIDPKVTGDQGKAAYRKAVEQFLLQLQSDPNKFKDVFKRS